MRLFLRLVHFLIVIYLVSGIFYIYYCAFTKTVNSLLLLFVISLIVEGIIIYVNKGNCPFGYFQRMYGDNKPFFELILPKRYAKKAVKFFAVLTLLGLLFLILRILLG